MTDYLFKLIYLHQTQIDVVKIGFNKMKAVLLESGKANKWLAEKLDKNEILIFLWCTNYVQLSENNRGALTKLQRLNIKEPINSTKR